MNTAGLGRYALTTYAAAAMLTGCGGVQFAAGAAPRSSWAA
ncbi:MAG: hypothetical protein WAL67_14570 [Candidatus Cybelea sp.]